MFHNLRNPQDDQSQGMFGGVGNWLGNNSNALIGLGAGIAGGGNLNQAVSQGLQGMMTGRQQDTRLQQQQAMLQGLIGQGLSPQQAQLALFNPEFMKALIPNMVPKYDQGSTPGYTSRFNPATGQYDFQGALPKWENVPEGGTGGVVTLPVPGGRSVPMPSPTLGVPLLPAPAPAPAPAAQPGSLPSPMPPANVRVGAPLVQGKDQGWVAAGSFMPVITSLPKAPPGSMWNDLNDPNKGQRLVQGGIPYADALAKLSDDFRTDKNIQNYQTVVPIIESAREASVRGGGAADLNIIYAMGKIFDPGSVVREAELIMGQKSAGPLEALAALETRIKTGQGLSEDARKRIISELESRVDKLKTSHDRAMDHYTYRAKTFGIDPGAALYQPRPDPAGIR